ncbi:putative disease resistance protein RGA3 [Elaeis guineensis]|uniref:Disease resistance protein RGA3 n=1 Tax=Elaeis guineensis var. tenera TaxID=51953 RepID=A0A6I9S7D3_ELAGV|nr:putative disease resistance protein RGA3 [Elaeis guineensis]
MAGAILSSIISIAGKLIAPIRGSSAPNPFSCVKEDLKHLRRTLLRIQAVLNDAEMREIQDESVKLWLHELKSLSNDAEDVLDEYNYELLRIQIEGGTSSAPSSKRKRGEVMISSSTNFPFTEGMAVRIREIRMRFDEIAKERDALHLREEDGERRFLTTGKPPPTSSIVDEWRVYGREEEKRKLTELLLYNEDKFSVIPIIGMGGVGKTTLAQLVYNDSVVCQQFSTKIWVSVSEDFDVMRITKTIIKSIASTSSSADDHTELDNLHSTLTKALEGKRLLLVLDDVWNERPSLWETLRAPLVQESTTSKIIVTTRNESVARIMQTVTPIRLGSLDDDYCWLVFKTYAFERQVSIKIDAPPNLEAIGRKIALKCKGLPLAAKTLGSLLRFETDEERWKDISESELWHLFDEERNEILPALSLSYHRMPAHLKQCFAYCSLFPQGYLFEKEYMVNLWMAQGYIRQDGRNSVEAVGSSYFDELVQRSFFQHSQLDAEVGKFVMHDLIHDLAKSISGSACVMTEDHKLSNLPEDVLHASLLASSDYHGVPDLPFLQNKKKGKGKGLPQRIPIRLDSLKDPLRLRTLLIPGSNRLQPFEVHLEMQNDQFQNLTCLRAMDLSHSAIEELPDSIGELKHLRYLRLQNTSIRVLPESVCVLYNLQVLDLKHCYDLLELPRGIGNLTSLRHLILPILDDSHVCIPPGIGKLIHLQTLPIFYVGYKCHCGTGELKDLTNLKLRELRMVGLEKVTEEMNPDLKKMKNIQKLTLCWHSHSYEPCSYRGNTSIDDAFVGRQSSNNVSNRHGLAVDKSTAASTLENLQPHTNISELVIRGYNGTRLPCWMGDRSFSKLVSVKLEFCNDKCALLPPLGQLPSLRILSIGGMESLRGIGREFCGCASDITKAFPALETLEFTEMWEWEEWCGIKDGEFPRLRELTISDCPKLCRLPGLPSSPLTELELYECKALTAIPALPSLVSLKLWGECNFNIWSSSLDLPRLQYLKVSNSHRLRMLHLHQNLSSLRVVRIENCPNLTTTAGLQCFSSLQCLEIYKCGHSWISRDEKLASKTLVCFWPSDRLPHQQPNVVSFDNTSTPSRVHAKGSEIFYGTQKVSQSAVHILRRSSKKEQLWDIYLDYSNVLGTYPFFFS